jgi:hypothetical protein
MVIVVRSHASRPSISRLRTPSLSAKLFKLLVSNTHSTMPEGRGRATTKKVVTWKKLLEIDEHQKGKSQMTDGERKELISSHLHDYAHEGKCTHHKDSKILKKCSCLGFLKSDVNEDDDVKVDEHGRGNIFCAAIAKYVL